MKEWILTIFYINVLLLIGCASGNIVINSTPNTAEVYLRSSQGSDLTKLGETPLNIPLKNIKEKVKNNLAVIEVKSEGYISKELLISDLNFPNEMSLQITLNAISNFLNEQEIKNQALNKIQNEAEKDAESISQLNSLIDQLFEVQRLIQSGRSSDALAMIKELKKQNNNLSVLYELEGGIAYMQKDFKKALDEYRIATRNNPKNIELLNLKNYLEENLQLNKEKQ